MKTDPEPSPSDWACYGSFGSRNPFTWLWLSPTRLLLVADVTPLMVARAVEFVGGQVPLLTADDSYEYPPFGPIEATPR